MTPSTKIGWSVKYICKHELSIKFKKENLFDTFKT